MKPIRCVISGSMCSGKTTTINELEKEFKVFHDNARVLIKNYFGDSTKIDRDFLERKLIEIHKKDFNEAEGICFFDQGLIDCLAFYLMDSLDVPSDLLEEAKKFKYDYIFFLENPDFYENDEIRKENIGQREKLGEAMIKLYFDLGYNVIKVPFMSVIERIKFIKKHLKLT